MAIRHLKINRHITTRDEASLDKYLREVARIDLLSAEEEVELARKISIGDKLALNRLTTANLRFVISVSKQYQHQGLSLSDLINEGNLGLIKAAHKFDHSRGFKFISYAVWWIRQSILLAISEQSRVVRLPFNKTNSITKVNQGFSKLEQEFHREPTAFELSAVLRLSEDEVEDSIRLTAKSISMDAPITRSGEHGFSMHDFLADENYAPESHLMTESLALEIDRFLKILPQRESNILKLFFGLKGESQHSIDEISTKMGLSPERIRQVKERALRYLKANSQSKILRTYLA